MRLIVFFLLLSFIKHPALPDGLPKITKHHSTPEAVTAVQAQNQTQISELPAGEALQQARLFFIRQRSSFFNKEKLERELLKRKEFGEMKLEITRSITNADLVLEITRKRLTTRFTCNVIEPKTQRILAGTTASSLGGEVEPNLADAIVKELKAKRAKPATPATEEKKPE